MSGIYADNLRQQMQSALFAPLAALRARFRAYLAVRGSLELLAALAGASLIQLGIDRWLRLSVDQRAALNVAITFFWFWVLYRRLLMPLLHKLPNALLALWIDRANPDLRDHLSTAIQLFGALEASPDIRSASGPQTVGPSPTLVRATLESACSAAQRVSFNAVLDHRKARNRLIQFAMLTALISAAFTVAPETMSVWFRRNWLLHDVAWPQRTYVRPLNFDDAGQIRLPRGDELVIMAEVEGEMPQSALLVWETPTGRSGREVMTRLGGRRLMAAIGALSEDVHFRIVGGDERTRQYDVLAVDRPRVIQAVARVTPPAYTRLESVEFEQQTVLEMLRGSSLELHARVNKPLREARFFAAEAPVENAHVHVENLTEGGAIVVLEWPEPASGVYRFDLLDADDIKNRDPVRYTLKVVADAPPNSTVAAQNVRDVITPDAELAAEITATDAYGLAAVRLFIARNDEPAAGVPLPPVSEGQRQYRASTLIRAQSARVRPGDRLRLWAEAIDLNPAEAVPGRSPVIDLTVLSRDDFLAHVAQRELELRREFERLISAQRALTDAFERILPDLSSSGPAPDRESHRLAGLVRRQAAHAVRCRTIARQYEQILGEMKTSKVARTAEEQRILERVVRPLDGLAAQTMPDAGDAIAALRADCSQPILAGATQLQADVMRQMRSILANMLEWEGYREAVALLQEIIGAQGEVRDATIKAVEQELQEILDLFETDKSVAPNPPNP